MWVGVVGGVGDEWRWVVGGPPLGGAGAAAARARPGELVLTADAAAAGRLSGPAVEGDPSHVEIAAVDAPSSAPDQDADERHPGGPTERLPSEDHLATFLPRELVSRIRAGQTGWLAEFRRLTVVFVGIRGFDGGAPGALTLAQTAFRAAQTLIDRYGGSLNQIVDDDKGLTLVAAWGLPDRTHEDDPARGLLAARSIVDAFGELGLDVSAGVTTGRAFTGVRGGPIRCEYSMVGDVVNLAARLMQSGSSAANAEANGAEAVAVSNNPMRDGRGAGEVRSDASTARAATARLEAMGLQAVALGAVKVKGKAQEVETFRIEPRPSAGTDRPAGTGEPAAARAGRELIGRSAEWRTLTERVRRLGATGLGGVVVLEGEPGVGKSELVGRLVESTPPPVRVHLGEADAIERSTPYYIWRRPLLELLDVDGVDRSALEAAVLARLGGDPVLLERASLLNAILPIELAVPERIAELEADVRADAIRDLVIQLIATAAATAPRMILLEDVHWADFELMGAPSRRRPARSRGPAGPFDPTDGRSRAAGARAGPGRARRGAHPARAPRRR